MAYIITSLSDDCQRLQRNKFIDIMDVDSVLGCSVFHLFILFNLAGIFWSAIEPSVKDRLYVSR